MLKMENRNHFLPSNYEARFEPTFCDADIQFFLFVFSCHTEGPVSVFTILRKKYNEIDIN